MLGLKKYTLLSPETEVGWKASGIEWTGKLSVYLWPQLYSMFWVFLFLFYYPNAKLQHALADNSFNYSLVILREFSIG